MIAKNSFRFRATFGLIVNRKRQEIILRLLQCLSFSRGQNCVLSWPRSNCITTTSEKLAQKQTNWAFFVWSICVHFYVWTQPWRKKTYLNGCPRQPPLRPNVMTSMPLLLVILSFSFLLACRLFCAYYHFYCTKKLKSNSKSNGTRW